MILGVLPYYVKAVLDVAKPGTWVAILTAVEIVSMLASVRLAARIARRTSKRHAYRLAMIGAACVFPCWPSPVWARRWPPASRSGS